MGVVILLFVVSSFALLTSSMAKADSPISLVISSIFSEIEDKFFRVSLRVSKAFPSFSVPKSLEILAVRLFRLYPCKVLVWRIFQY